MRRLGDEAPWLGNFNSHRTPCRVGPQMVAFLGYPDGSCSPETPAQPPMLKFPRCRSIRNPGLRWNAGLCLGLACLAGCGHRPISPPTEATEGGSQSWPQRLAAKHLPNSLRIHERVISGGLPAGEHAFAELRELGVRTIVSVDGARPDVALAAKFGLRYVHLPHGYDGIPQSRVAELAKAVRDLESPIYIHCHHGKHRSPAAAAVACVASGLTPPSSAMSILELAGTSPKYRGLFEAVEHAQPLEAEFLQKLQVEFPEIAQLPPLAEAMVVLEQVHDRVAAIARAGWRAPAEHPDLDPCASSAAAA